MSSDCATTTRATRNDELSPVALMGVFHRYERKVVNGIRAGVLEENFRKSIQPVKDAIASTTVRMKRRTFPMMDSNVRTEEDMRGFLTEEIE